MNNKIKALLSLIGFLSILTALSLGLEYFPDIMLYVIVGLAFILCLWVAYNIALEYYNAKDRLNEEKNQRNEK